jgi:lambda family phage portal protein
MKVNSNWVDKLYQYVAPITAVKRLHARQQLAFAGNSNYRGASRYQNSLSDWKVSCGDADSDLSWDLPTLRQRSRDLLRNNPLALGAINTICTNVIGTGLKLHARLDRDVLKLTDEEADKWEANTEREFRLWAESTSCDAARTLTFTSLQELAFRSTLENGDCFVLLSYRNNPQNLSINAYSFQNPYSLSLQLIEADRLCNKDYVADTDTLIQGVQKNREGAPIAYHVLQKHPGSGMVSKASGEWVVVPAFSCTGQRLMLHLYSMRRAGQTRGIPYLAPVIESLKQLDRYTQAEITAAVISSLFTVFVKTPEGDGNLVSKAINSTQNQLNPHHYHLQGGNVVNLAHGEDITTANPGRPNEQFDPFVQAILRQIGVALELPFEVLIKHFTASYSAARAALLEAWRFFSAKRTWFAESFCQPVYEAWLLEAVSLGRVPAPGFLTSAAIRQAYLGSEWTGPAPGQIDPLKEIQAAKERVEMGISTLARETATLTGEDWEQIHRQAIKELKMRQTIVDKSGE